MTLLRDSATKNYSADVRDRQIDRLHVSLRTTRKAEATERYAAVCALVREGDLDLITQLRRRTLNVEAVARCYRERKSFRELVAATVWPTLGNAVEHYVEAIERHPRRAAHTAQGARVDLRSATKHFGATTPLTAITHEMVAAYRDELSTTCKPATVALKLQRLGALYHWHQRQEERRAQAAKRAPALLFCPVVREEMPVADTARVRFLEAEEIQAVMAATPAQYQLLVALGLLAGLRVDEARVLRPPPLDITRELTTIFVQPKPMPRGKTWRPKTAKSQREIPITRALRPFLERHLAKGYANEAWLFPAPSGSGRSGGPTVPMSDDLLHRTIKRIAEDAGLKGGRTDPQGVTYHTLRHSFASHLAMAGVDLFTISRLLGHTSTALVEQTYAHLAPEHRRAAVDRLSTQLADAFPQESGPRHSAATQHTVLQAV